MSRFVERVINGPQTR